MTRSRRLVLVASASLLAACGGAAATSPTAGNHGGAPTCEPRMAAIAPDDDFEGEDLGLNCEEDRCTLDVRGVEVLTRDGVDGAAEANAWVDVDGDGRQERVVWFDTIAYVDDAETMALREHFAAVVDADDRLVAELAVGHEAPEPHGPECTARVTARDEDCDGAREVIEVELSCLPPMCADDPIDLDDPFVVETCGARPTPTIEQVRYLRGADGRYLPAR
ncbi:MAG: hypothetical protein R2939_02760 [Kofleriaceae bacterium]